MRPIVVVAQTPLGRGKVAHEVPRLGQEESHLINLKRWEEEEFITSGKWRGKHNSLGSPTRCRVAMMQASPMEGEGGGGGEGGRVCSE